MTKTSLIDQLQSNMPITKRLFHLRSSQMLENYGLSHSQFEALFALYHAKTTSLKDLACLLHVTPSAVSPVVESLVKLGYVERTNDSLDRRIFNLKLSENGKKIAKTITGDKKIFFKDILSSLCEDDLKTLVRLQSHLIEDILAKISNGDTDKTG